jgi:hypothetical protein
MFELFGASFPRWNFFQVAVDPETHVLPRARDSLQQFCLVHHCFIGHVINTNSTPRKSHCEMQKPRCMVVDSNSRRSRRQMQLLAMRTFESRHASIQFNDTGYQSADISKTPGLMAQASQKSYRYTHIYFVTSSSSSSSTKTSPTTLASSSSMISSLYGLPMTGSSIKSSSSS